MSRDFNGSYVRKAGLICGFLIVIAASNFISYRSAVKNVAEVGNIYHKSDERLYGCKS